MKFKLYKNSETVPFRLITDSKKIDINPDDKRVYTYDDNGSILETFILKYYKTSEVHCENGFIEGEWSIWVAEIPDKNTVKMGIKEVYNN